VPSWGTALTLTARASGGHGVEYWLTICTAGGLLTFGWLCVALRAINALCAVAADPAWRVGLVTARVAGAPVRRRDAVRFALWRSVGAGAWSREALAVGEWTARGSLFGASVGIFVFVFAARGGTVQGGAIVSMHATTTKHRAPSYRLRAKRWAALWVLTVLAAAVVGAVTAGWSDGHKLIAVFAVLVVAALAAPLFLLGPEVREMRRRNALPTPMRHQG
jgi:hypothetical protein